MESSLKTEAVHIKSLGREVELREVNAATQIALLEELREMRDRNGDDETFTPADNIRIAAITCAGCVVGWEDETPESILKSHSANAIIEIAAAAQRRRRPRSKNSESVPSDDSSTG